MRNENVCRASHDVKESGGIGGRAMRLVSGRGVGQCILGMKGTRMGVA